MEDADADLTRGLRDGEHAAAQAVQRVLGGTWDPHDTGAEDGMFDVLLTLDGGDASRSK